MCSQNYSHHDRLKIEGYAWPLSVEPGESVSLHISTNARTFSCTVARVGNSREVVWKKESVPGRLHAVPSNAASHGCDWPACLRLRVPEDWKSGYYHVTLSGSDGSGFVAVGEIFFVVRAGKIRSRRLLVLSTNTYNAYNTWGGASFYHGPEGPGRRLSFHRPLANFQRAEGLYKLGIPVGTEDAISMLDKGIVSEVLASEAAKCGVPLSQQASVTVERPGVKWKIIDIFGVGGCYQVKREDQMINFYNRSAAWLSGWHTWERHFVSWAELNGYDLDYATSLDLEFRPEILQHYRLVLSVGHDEYWSSPMRDNLETFISAGGNAVFLSGNVAYWQVRSEDEGTAIVCWKNDYKNDPVYRTGERALLSTLWCHRLISRPENQLTGVSFAFGGYHRFFDQYHDAPHAYRVHKPDHWIFEGTGLIKDDLLGVEDEIVNYECDGCDFKIVKGIPVPTYQDGTPLTFEILASAPAGLSVIDGSFSDVVEALYGRELDQSHPRSGLAVLGCYTRGGTVVTAGCTDWVRGLQGQNKLVERVTINILDRLSSMGVVQ